MSSTMKRRLYLAKARSYMLYTVAPWAALGPRGQYLFQKVQNRVAKFIGNHVWTEIHTARHLNGLYDFLPISTVLHIHNGEIWRKLEESHIEEEIGRAHV